MAVFHGQPDLRGVEREIAKLRQGKWHQKWWGGLISGIIASSIVAMIFYFL